MANDDYLVIYDNEKQKHKRCALKVLFVVFLILSLVYAAQYEYGKQEIVLEEYQFLSNIDKIVNRENLQEDIELYNYSNKYPLSYFIKLYDLEQKVYELYKIDKNNYLLKNISKTIKEKLENGKITNKNLYLIFENIEAIIKETETLKSLEKEYLKTKIIKELKK